MIIDTLAHFEQYMVLHPFFAEVKAFLDTHKLNEMPDGKYVIRDNELFLNLQTVEGRIKEKAVFEYHRKMIDIQIPLNTTECFGYKPVVELPTVPFNEENDIAKIPLCPVEHVVTCTPGMFAVFFPQDGHAPCICKDSTFRKAVFKVKL